MSIHNTRLFVNGELHHIELWPNRDFIHPHLVIERRDPTLPVQERDVRGIGSLKKMCYYNGKVRGVKSSRAALSTCDGLAGSLQIGNKLYFIEPVHEHSPNADGHHLHVVYADHPSYTKGYCGVKSSPENWKRSIEERLRKDFTKDKILFKKSAETYEVVPQWIQMMITGDKKFVNKHKGKRDVLQYLLTLMNMVRDFYADETMTAYMTPVVIRIILLEKEEEEIDLDISWDIDKTLKSFCAWSLKMQKPNGSVHHFDTSVLLTEWDFCHDNPGGEKDCGVEGIGMVGHACGESPCQLNEDQGFMTGLTISHEQGHLLGMDHDQYPPRCPENDTESYYIMAPVTDGFVVKWSPCSTAAMRELARNHFLDCLNDEPHATDYTIPDGMPGVTSDIAEQCNIYVPGRNFTDTCDAESCRPIYCAAGDICTSFDAQVADGTTCGENKWCFRAQCIDKGTRSPQSVDGAWGEWTEWTTCSRTCGKGIQRRERFCDNPKPANKGKYCLGERNSFKICINEDCPDDQPSFREQQCRSKFNPAEFRINITLSNLEYPVIEPEKPCVIYCSFKYEDYSTTEDVGTADDGTICTPGVPNKICIDGSCKEVGCDGKLESTAVEDRCGVCNGDGTMCKVVNTVWNSPPIPQKYPKITDIPVGAKKIEVSENSASGNIIAMGTADGKTWYLNGNYVLQQGGTKLIGKKNNMWGYYSGNDATKESFTLDQAREELAIYLGMAKADNVAYTYKWIEHSDEPTYEPKYAWDTDEFQKCNAQCGGGTQMPMFHCTEEKAGKVSNTYCEKLDKPSGEPRKCNDKPCETEWKAGSWGRCRACKKKGGVRVRTVECVRKNQKFGADDILQEDSECKAPKPGTVELCETLIKCGSRRKRTYHIPGMYQETIWQQMKKLHLVKRAAPVKFATVTQTFPRRPSTRTTRSTRLTQTPYTGSVPTPKKGIVIDKGKERKMVEVERKIVKVGNLSELDMKMGAKPGTKIVLGTTKVISDFWDKLKCEGLKINRQKKLNRTKKLKSTTVTHSLSTTKRLP